MSSKLLKKSCRLALVQLKVGSNKQLNLANAARLVASAASTDFKANIVVLPECFNSPYGTGFFNDYAEDNLVSGETAIALKEMAKSNGIYLVGGSFPERQGSLLFNTCTVWNPKGDMIGVHRKLHLFDICVKDKITFKESDVLTAGSNLTHIDTEYGKIGIGICYDMRFPELATIAARKHNVFAMIYPGAFNMTTGPLHWELLQRARALDNQIYLAACSPARDTTASYIAWGHSSIIDPMGRVVATTNENESIVVAELDPSLIQETRESIPVYNQRRFDLYTDVAES